MAEEKKIPAGFAVLKSGVMVTRDLALSTTQNSQFAWQLRGTENAETRGEDRADANYERLLAQVETSRKRDPLLFRGVDYFDKLTLGTGLKIVPADDSTEAKAVLDAAMSFWEANNFDDLQHRIAVELATTGNVFAWLPPLNELTKSDKSTAVIPSVELIPSAQIWRIATKDGRAWYYRRKWTQYEYKEPVSEVKSGRVPAIGTPKVLYRDLMAEDVVHTAINRGAAELRGISSLEPAIYWSSLYGRTLETVWAHALAKSILALHIQAGDATPEQIKELRETFESSILVDRTDPRGMTYKSLATGQAFITGGGMKVDVLDSKTTAGSSDAELRRMLLMSATAMGLPEFALSDGNYANLASSYSQSNPFFRLMESFQASIIGAVRGILRVAFDRYIESGLFATRTRGEHPIASITIVAPKLLEPEIDTLGPVAVQLVNAGIWSKAYACERMGIDWQKIKEEIDVERAEGHGPVIPQPTAFPFSAEAKLGEETRTETQELVAVARAKMLKRLREYKERLLASNGFRGEMLAAYREFKTRAFADLQELMQTANAVGKESVGAAS